MTIPLSPPSPPQRYNALLEEQRTLRELNYAAQAEILLAARHPELAPDSAHALKTHEDCTARLEAIQATLLALEQEPEVRRMLAAKLGLTPQGRDAWEPVLRPFSEIVEKPVPWLWAPYIPLGRLTLLEGDPGHGKSWFALAVATCASLGTWMDTGAHEPHHLQPAGTVYWTCEDDAEDTTKPRLRMLQGDQTRIFELTAKRRANQAVELTLKDLPILQTALQRTQAKLLVIDPIQGVLPSGTDMNRAEQIRPLLQGLQRLAKAEQCAVLIIRHLTKSSKEKVSYKGLGSIDFFAAARSALYCAEQPEHQVWSAPIAGKPVLLRRRFAAAQIKNNLTRHGPALVFEVSAEGFQWVGQSDVTAEQLAAGPLTSSEDQTNLREAKAFLETCFKTSAQQEIDTIRSAAKQAGVAWKSVLQAKALLPLKALQEGERWYWAWCADGEAIH
jgi:AAA domain